MGHREKSLFVAAFAVLACGGAASEGDSQREPLSVSQVDRIWIFSHRPDAWNTARHSGYASIDGDCLLVGDHVVIWAEQRLSEAQDLVRAVKRGERPYAVVGGSALFPTDSDVVRDVPSEVLERCPDKAIWSGAPDVPHR